MDRERRLKGTTIRIVNTTTAVETYNYLKAQSRKRRVSMGVLIDQLVKREIEQLNMVPRA